MAITWTNDLNTGISVIDQQHMRIVEYINKLEQDALRSQDSGSLEAHRQNVARVLDNLVDYTLSHFAFEESLQEEAGYPYCKPHKKVHGLFIRRVGEYIERFRQGEEVAPDIHKLLCSWLINHIKREDLDYVAVVQAYEKSKSGAPNLLDKTRAEPAAARPSWFKRLFG